MSAAEFCSKKENGLEKKSEISTPDQVIFKSLAFINTVKTGDTGAQQFIRVKEENTRLSLA